MLQNSIFHFNDSPALDIQDTATCQAIWDDFWKKVALSDWTKIAFPYKDFKEYASMCREIHWFPNYGGAVLFRKLDSIESFVTVVGLDGWKSRIHASEIKGRESTAEPDVFDPFISELGPFPADKLKQLVGELNGKLHESEDNNRGNGRGQGGGHEGNQKTPSFLREKLRQAIDVVGGTDKKMHGGGFSGGSFQGGTTDVGLHTGCLKRNTSAPLVFSVVHVILKFSGEPNADCFRTLLTIYLTGFLEDFQIISSYEARQMDRYMTVIRVAEAHVAKLTNTLLQNIILDYMKGFHDKLLAVPYSNGPIKWENEPIFSIVGRLSNPKVPAVPSISGEPDPASKLDRARIDAKDNLDWCDIETESFNGKRQDAWVQLAVLNAYFWDLSGRMNESNQQVVMNDVIGKLDRLTAVVKIAAKGAEENVLVVATALRSYEFLATWICFCWAHKMAETKVAWFAQCKPALDPEDLQVLVLECKEAFDAANSVREFLEARSNRACCPFRDNGDTLRLALEYGVTCDRFRTLHGNFYREAEKKIDQRWEVVRKKQSELRILDLQLRLAHDELSSVVNERVTAEQIHVYYNRQGRRVYETGYHVAVEKERQAQAKVDRLELQIRQQKKKPANLSFGLPRGVDSALKWLFFLYMEPSFQQVAALAHRGQSMLWSEAPSPKQTRLFLHDWFCRHGSFEPVNLGKMILGSNSEQPKTFTPDIRIWTRETGVFFPDSFSEDPVWHQSNPFDHVDKRALALLYTEGLPKAEQQRDKTYMQQLIAMLPSPRRENDGISRREKRPDWLSPEQFNSFSSMRATPRTQIRHFLQSFYEHLLPSERPGVHVLLKQTIFQFGDADWSRDFSHRSSNGLDILCECLMNEVRDLSESPKNCDRLQLIGILLSFYGQYHTGCAKASRLASRTFERWAKAMDDDLQDGNMNDSFAKQAFFYASALFCLSNFELHTEDIKMVARLIVLFRNSSLLSRGHADLSLEEPVLKIMGERVKQVTHFARLNPSYLSVLLKLVDETALPSGKWCDVVFPGTTSTACFEMADDHLYSINLLNGVVLFDGSPKKFLPHSIVEKEIFQRTFGRQNFEVVRMGFQHYRTAKITRGKVYEFKADLSTGLCIFEYDFCPNRSVPNESSWLRLLPRSSVEIATVLQEPYSHWYSRCEDAVLIRPPQASQKEVHYVMTQQGTFLVPQKDREMSYAELFRKKTVYERLYVGTTSFGTVLNESGFEKQCFVLTLADPSGNSIRHFLPRFGLNFVQDCKGVWSQDYEGFSVSKKQELENTLPNFKCYLSLTSSDRGEIVLSPHVQVKRAARMTVSDCWNDDLHVHEYRRHKRFGHLIPSDTLGALHLASIYASNGCLLPDRLMSKPGSDVAADLVRQCAQNESFGNEEQHKLAEISSHSSLSCSLRILLWWTWRSSIALVQPYCRLLERETSLGYDSLAVDEYRCNKYATRLEIQEEAMMFGTTTKQSIIRKKESAEALKSLASAHARYVRDQEENIFIAGVKVSIREGELRFPLDVVAEDGGIPAIVMEDLRSSFDTFSRLPRYSVLSVDADSFLHDAKARRNKLEESLLVLLNKAEDHELVGPKITGRIQRATCVDLMKIAYDPNRMLLYRPFIENMLSVQADCIGWCLLCVFEDKLCRLKRAISANKEDDAIQEIRCLRNWDPTIHPRWLAFEVEQMLQIRPKQYTTVEQLLNNPGSVIQLNMGLGKTRVLVPMLIMELCGKQGKKARINLLASIFHEALQFYRRSLLASAQNIKLFTIPFQRDFVLDKSSRGILLEEMRRCWGLGGCIVATPQHRNSLLLKQYDSELFIPDLNGTIVDILDESDAILDYNFQLVYAIGDQVPLPSCINRCAAVETVLAIASHLATDISRTQAKNSFLCHHESVPSGEFSNVRIVDASRAAESDFVRAIASNLVNSPPHHFRWMKHIHDNHVSDLLLTILVDPAFEDVGPTLTQYDILNRNQDDILALRGCLAFGLVSHALKNRYRVSYGLKIDSSQESSGDRLKTATKLAVPYAASDTPKERAEFSHPDMAIIYTCLSYLHDGLSLIQFKEAMKILESKSAGLQKWLFRMWIESIREGVPRDELERYDKFQKIDTTNEEQVRLMHSRLRRCMKVVFFWLNEVVFPNETHQFPQRRVTSAWNLTASQQAIGFSGTNDNRFLLPLSVRQLIHKEKELHATNGEMIQLILDSTKRVHLFGSSTDTSSWWKYTKGLFRTNDLRDKPPLWQVILAESLQLEATALIDAGGLMAGASASDIVNFLASNVESHPVRDTKLRGVVYFSVNTNQWMVYQLESKRLVSLTRSPIKEDKCFVYFDESRCRGSDMKLLPSAGAIVTLDKRMTKDKFLQGCARMRKLGSDGQWLIIAGTEESVDCKSTAKSVLEGIIQASILAAQRGLITFYDRARNFESFPDPVDDELELESLYGGHITEYDDFCHYLDSHHENQALSEGMEKVVEYCHSKGQGVDVHISTFGQECEKEVEAETEEQQEQETQIELREPYNQVDWDYAKVFSGSNKQLFVGTFVKLGDMIEKKLPPLAAIKWSEKVYCSPNFFKTTSCYSQSTNLSLYLRPATHSIIFRDGSVVLVSAYEMDKLLPHWWKEGGRPRAVLNNLFLLNKGGISLDKRTLPVSAEVMASLKLFRGWVDYTDEEKIALHDMLRNVERPHDKVQELLFMRNRLGHFERSDLDEVSYLVGNGI